MPTNVLCPGQNRVPLLVMGREAICDSHRIVEHLRRRDGQ
jgi:hypothetical protein